MPVPVGVGVTPRVPHQTPMYEADGKMTRTWIIFFERLGNHLQITEQIDVGNHVIGWDIQDDTVGSDVSDPVIPAKAGQIANCAIRVKVYDATNPLEIDVDNNGVSIFNTTPTVAAGGSTRDVYEFSDFSASPLSIAVFDDVVLNIVQGNGDWEFAVYLIYQEET